MSRETRPIKIVVVGSANMDYTMYVDRIPRIGETVLGGRMETSLGGKGANQAIAARRSGADTTFIAKIGKDANGELCRLKYANEGVCLDFLRAEEGLPTATAVILVDAEGHNLIAVDPGANEALQPSELRTSERAFKDADTLILQQEIPAETNFVAAQLAHRNGVRVVLNAAPAHQIEPTLAKLVDVLIVNEHEAEVILNRAVASIDEAIAAAQALAKAYSMAIVTLGAAGAVLASSNGVWHVPGFPVNAVDAVGAGDTFTGAFAWAWSSGLTPREAVEFANAAAALSVTQKGAIPSIPTFEAVCAFRADRMVP